MAFGVLFRPFNDIDVYVEDSVGRNVYECLIERMLNGRAKVTRVVQLGSRQQVLAHCAQDQSEGGRPRLYVIDGDIDLLTGVPAPSLKHLYRLAVYCSENLLVTENAIIEVAFDSDGEADKQALRDTVRFEDAVREWEHLLGPLFVLYAAAAALDLPIETAGYHVMNLCTVYDRRPKLDASKVEARRDVIRDGLVAAYGSDAVDATISAVERRWLANPRAVLAFISGKSYLLPLVDRLLRDHTGYRGTVNQLKTQLSRHAEVAVDHGLQAAVVSCSRMLAA